MTSDPAEPGHELAELRRAVADLHGHLAHLEGAARSEVHLAEGHFGRGRGAAGEQRWPVAVAVAVAIALQIALPERLSLGPSFLLPALEFALLVGLTAANPRRIDRASRALRGASIALIALTSVANGWSSAQLVDEIITGSAGKAAGPLLATGASIYLTNIIVFSLWYWEADAGGPVARAVRPARPDDFLFPQMAQPGIGPEGWRPTYFDYLYTSYTNATAFSPTDVMPLTHRSKGLMGLQSAVALATVALVVARAVNILS